MKTTISFLLTLSFSAQLIAAESKIIAAGATLEKLAGDFSFTEGPACDAQGNVFFTDQPNDRILKWSTEGKLTTFMHPCGRANGLCFDAEGNLWACADEKNELWRISPAGTKEIVVKDYQGKLLNGPNDVWLKPDGALYFTDPTLDLVKGEKQELLYQGIFRMTDTGALKLLATDMAVPNGIAFSPDGKRLYVNDSKSREIRVYDFVGGELKNGRLFAKEAPGRGGPDGMKVDVEGNVWVTGLGGLLVFDSSGKLLGTISLFEPAANFAWGDAGFSTLYFCGRASIYKLKVKAKGFVPYVAYAKSR